MITAISSSTAPMLRRRQRSNSSTASICASVMYSICRIQDGLLRTSLSLKDGGRGANE